MGLIFAGAYTWRGLFSELRVGEVHFRLLGTNGFHVKAEIRELKKLRGQLQGKRLIKTEVSCDYSMLITLYKIGGVLFRLLATNGFRVKAKKERFTAASSRCRQNLKYENFASSFGRLRQNIAPKSVLHVQHDYFSSFNQSNH